MGDDHSLHNRVGISPERATEGFNRFLDDFPVLAAGRRKYQNMFCSMKQKRMHGKVEWHEPADYVESMLGFRRYFTLETNICRDLFNLAEDPPDEWLKLDLQVKRRDRIQLAGNAVRSALFGCAFTLQGANMRAAGNHRIQSTGGQITKELQHRQWSLQPVGIHPWKIMLLNVHDESNAARVPELKEELKRVTDEFNQGYTYLIPLIQMDWNQGLANWAEK